MGGAGRAALGACNHSLRPSPAGLTLLPSPRLWAPPRAPRWPVRVTYLCFCSPTPHRHVTTEDLAFFRSKVEAEDPSAAAKWDHMMDVTYEGTGYSAWRRGVAGGKTEYKSITIT